PRSSTAATPTPSGSTAAASPPARPSTATSPRSAAPGPTGSPTAGSPADRPTYNHQPPPTTTQEDTMPTTRRTPINPNTAAAELTRRIIKADPAACFGRRGTYDLIIDSCDCGCDRVGIRV